MKKKILSLILVGAMAFSMTACGLSKSEEPAAEAPKTEAPAADAAAAEGNPAQTMEAAGPPGQDRSGDLQPPSRQTCRSIDGWVRARDL